ncbi:general substrate transporter [Lentinula guzmanii]|uniref:General substrate transporter n=1 Tax=Lentinula guzmanii TaxID=2804957 RepID=A0AA38N1G1_9AGAR|nr:general substrate transporter [Lentinula guzmanii]
MTFRNELREIVRYRNAYLLAFSAAMGSIFYGWDIGLIGGVIAMSSFQESFAVDKLSTSAKADFNGNIVSILQGGCFFGALSMGYFSGKFGRKPCLIASGVIYIVGSAIQAIAGLGSSAATGLSVLYFSRFLGGIGVVWVNYSAVLNIAPTDMQWRIPFIVQIVPGALFTFGMLFQPESPRWLVEKGRYPQAAKTLAFVARISPEDPAVLVTLDEIKEEFEGKHKLSLWQQFKGMGASSVIANRCFIPALVMFFQQWTGTNAINYFSPEIFTGLGITGTSSTLFATGIYGVVISVGLVLMFAVESFGRKKCLIVGGIGQGLTMLWIGGYSSIHPSGPIVPASYVSLVAVYLYAVFYCVGWGPVPWVISAEVAPNHLRTISLSIAIGVNWLFSFTISKITPIMLDKITYGTFLIFGLMCIIMAAWAYIFLPETAGHALEDIHFLFEQDVIVRALQDAPLGRLFIGKKRALPVEELKKEMEANVDQKSIKEDSGKAFDDGGASVAPI